MNHVLDIPEASAGEKILPAYNRLVKTVRDWRLFHGDGMRVVETPMGTQVIRLPDRQIWRHPWRVELGGGESTVDPGLVNGEMAHIDGRPMDGRKADGTMDDRGIPTIKIDESMFEGNLSWLVLRVEASKKDLTIEMPARIEQEKERTWGAGYSKAQEEDGKVRGDFPLAMLRKDQEGKISCHQVAHFNVRCRVRPGKFWFFV